MRINFPFGLTYAGDVENSERFIVIAIKTIQIHIYVEIMYK